METRTHEIPSTRARPFAALHGLSEADLILDAATLPPEPDLFRLRQGATLIVANERFVETVRRLELDGVLFHELEVR